MVRDDVAVILLKIFLYLSYEEINQNIQPEFDEK